MTGLNDAGNVLQVAWKEAGVLGVVGAIGGVLLMWPTCGPVTKPGALGSVVNTGGWECHNALGTVGDEQTAQVIALFGGGFFGLSVGALIGVVVSAVFRGFGTTPPDDLVAPGDQARIQARMGDHAHQDQPPSHSAQRTQALRADATGRGLSGISVSLDISHLAKRRDAGEISSAQFEYTRDGLVQLAKRRDAGEISSAQFEYARDGLINA